MSEIYISPRTKVRTKTKQPRLHKVILLNDDYTPREFVVTVLKAVFGMSEEQAYRVMLTAHSRAIESIPAASRRWPCLWLLSLLKTSSAPENLEICLMG